MIMLLTGRGQRFHGAAVKGILCRNDAEFRRVLTAAIFTGKLDDSFIGFGTAIGKKDTVHPRYLSKLLRRLGLDFRIKKVGCMHDFPGLFAHRLDNRRMVIAQGIGCDPGKKVQIGLAVRII